jgi:hypothetical protein
MVFPHPVTQAVQRALTDSIVGDDQETPQDDENFSVELRSARVIGATIDGEGIPPHITGTVERLCARFIEMRELRRAAHSHQLLEQRHERAQGTEADRRRCLEVVNEIVHEAGAATAEQIPESLLQLLVGETSQQLPRTLERLRDELTAVLGAALPLGCVEQIVPSLAMGISDRMVKHVRDPIVQ